MLAPFAPWSSLSYHIYILTYVGSLLPLLVLDTDYCFSLHDLEFPQNSFRTLTVHYG